MELDVRAFDDGQKGKIEISDKIFGCDFNEPLVHQVVIAYLAGGRAGTHAQKTRSEVRGGGIKPWRQKGTGRARAGTIRSPLWRGGGVTFAAKTGDYTQKVNKKMHRAALASILSELIRLGRLFVVEKFQIDSHKTKTIVENLKKLGVTNALVIVDQIEKNLYLAARNLRNIEICNVSSINPVDLIRYENVIITSHGMMRLAEILK